MNKSRELFYCRFCAEKQPFDDLLDLDENPEDIKTCIERVNLLNIYFVNISSSKLPKLICEPCYNALYDASLFVSKVKEAQIIINNFIATKSEIESEDEPDSGDAQSYTGDNCLEDPDFEESDIELLETKFKTENDPLDTLDPFDVDANAIEEPEDTKENIAKDEVATCSDVNKNYNNTLETPPYLNRNIYDKEDLVRKGFTSIGISNSPCPLLKLHRECILKDIEHNKVEVKPFNDNECNQIWSISSDESEGDTVESVNNVDDVHIV